MKVLCDQDSRWADDGCIEVGGLLLCKAPVEIVEARRDYYNQLAQQQAQSAPAQAQAQQAQAAQGQAVQQQAAVASGAGSASKKKKIIDKKFDQPELVIS